VHFLNSQINRICMEIEELEIILKDKYYKIDGVNLDLLFIEIFKQENLKKWTSLMCRFLHRFRNDSRFIFLFKSHALNALSSHLNNDLVSGVLHLLNCIWKCHEDSDLFLDLELTRSGLWGQTLTFSCCYTMGASSIIVRFE
jgi:hypothetical protein